MMDYAIIVTKLSEANGGGYLAVVPDLYGCMSDGTTPEEAVTNVRQAALDWIEVSKEAGRSIPEVGSSAKRAKQREAALIDTIKILSEQLDGLDGRVERLFAEIEHVRDLIENQEAWSRFDALTQAGPRASESNPLPC